jgi:hypothetical protein
VHARDKKAEIFHIDQKQFRMKDALNSRPIAANSFCRETVTVGMVGSREGGVWSGIARGGGGGAFGRFVSRHPGSPFDAAHAFFEIRKKDPFPDFFPPTFLPSLCSRTSSPPRCRARLDLAACKSEGFFL